MSKHIAYGMHFLRFDLIKTCYAPLHIITISFTVQRSVTVCLSLQCPIFSWGSLISPFLSRCLQAELQKIPCALIVICSCSRLPRVHSEDIFPHTQRLTDAPFWYHLASFRLQQNSKTSHKVRRSGVVWTWMVVVCLPVRQKRMSSLATATDNLKDFERTLKMRQTLRLKPAANGYHPLFNTMSTEG